MGLHGDRLSTNKFGLDLGLAILKEHGNDLFEIRPKLVKGLALSMGARESRHVTDEEPGFRALFDDGCERSYAGMLLVARRGAILSFPAQRRCGGTAAQDSEFKVGRCRRLPSHSLLGLWWWERKGPDYLAGGSEANYR